MEVVNTKESPGKEDSLVYCLCDQFENGLCEHFEKTLQFGKGEDIANEIENVYAEYWNLHKARTAEVEELKTTLSNLQNEQMKLDSCKRELEETLETLKQKSDIAVKEEDELKKDIQTLKSVCEKKKEVIESLKEEAKPHPNDIAIIDKDRKYLKLYKDFTGIKFNYTATNRSSSVGVVFNATKHYIKCFSYSEKKRNMLWKDMEDAAMSRTSSQTSNNFLTGENRPEDLEVE